MVGQSLEQAARWGGGVTIPGGVQKTCRCGTSGYGLVGMVVLGWQLDLVTLEIFSNLNDSMILWFYDSMIFSKVESAELHAYEMEYLSF